MARRRAGLSQRELAERIGCKQATIARWERTDRKPSFDDVDASVRACSFQLEAHVAPEDRSWWPQIAVQLELAPLERLRRLNASGHGDLVCAVEALAAADVPALVVGEVAGALHGWPLVLGGDVIEVCGPPDRTGRALESAGARPISAGTYGFVGVARVTVVKTPPGTFGFRDLARAAQPVALAGGQLRLASIIDLLRIADASPDPAAARDALAYRALLDVQRARSAPRTGDARSDRERIDAWLTTQTPGA